MSCRKKVSPLDPDFEKVVLEWYKNLEDDDQSEQFIDDNGDGWSESDEDDIVDEHVEEEEHSESDPEPVSVDSDAYSIQEDLQDNQSYFTGKDSTKWFKAPPPPNTRTRSHNIVLRLPGPKGVGKEVKSEIQCLNCFIDDYIVNKITQYTNIYIEQLQQKFSRERDAKPTDEREIRALIGILYLAGVLKSGRQSIFQLWDNSQGTGVEAIYLTMSRTRFQFLMRCLRFDDIRDRAQRREVDRLAPVREIFEHSVKNFQKHYNPSFYLTIDEQLISFRGKCPFRQYIPNKPAKYGLKIFALVDTKNAYAYNLEIYAGRQPEGPFQTSWSGADVVRRMINPIDGTSRNITVDNWFSSVPLALELFEKNKLTMVGTLRKNKREIPPEFLATRNRELNSSLFGFHKKGCTLVSYMPQKNKTVLAISTMHNDMSIDADTGDQRKPEIITSYNQTKYGVDLLDQLCAQYDVSRNSRRWPLTIFFDLLNISAVNAYCLYKANNDPEMKFLRRKFLQDLSFQLIRPLMIARLESHIPIDLKRRIEKLLGIRPERMPENPQRRSAIGRCYICGRERNKSTRRSCHTCGRWVCPAHLQEVCVNCANEPDDQSSHSEDELA